MDREESFDQLASVDLGVHVHAEIHSCFVYHLSVHTVRQIVEKRLKDKLQGAGYVLVIICINTSSS